MLPCSFFFITQTCGGYPRTRHNIGQAKNRRSSPSDYEQLGPLPLVGVVRAGACDASFMDKTST
jgi:hypothetical protein